MQGRRNTENQELIRPREAAEKLGIAISTLRLYSVKFRDVLSQEAGLDDEAGARPGARRYSTNDLAALRKAKALLSRGYTYGQVLEALRGDGPTASASAHPTGTKSVVNFMEEIVQPLKTAIEQAAAGMDAWRHLAEEREQEVLRLRERVSLLERRLAEKEGRKSLWKRLFG